MSGAFVTLVVLVVSGSLVVADPVEPIFKVDGDIDIICLFDIHTKFEDGACSGFQEDTMEMAYTTLWKFEQLNAASQSTPTIGISVYDVCGSDKRAIEIISHYISIQQYNQINTTSLTGIVSYTGLRASSAISSMAHHLHLPHIQLTDDVIPDDQHGFDNRQIMSLTPKTRVEAAVDALGLLNWTYASVQTLDTITARSEQKYLSARLKEVGICQQGLVELPTTTDGTLEVSKSKPKGIIVFTGDHFTRSELHGVQKDPDNKVLIVGDMGNISRANLGDDVMVLIEQYTQIEGLAEFIADHQNYSTIYLPRFNCSDNSTDACDVPLMTSQRLHMTASAIKAMYNVLQMLALVECTSDQESCPTSRIQEMLEYHTNGGHIEEWRPYVQLVPLSHSFQRESDTTLSNLHGSVKVEGRLQDDVYQSQCEENCLVCSTCTAKYSSTERIIVQEADIFIVGSFPIFKSTIGNRCGVANHRGFRAARSFLSAIESFKYRYNDTIALQNITIGGVVLDSCPYINNLHTRIYDLESCIYNYRDASGHVINIPPSRTTGYFNYFDEIDSIAGMNNSTKLTGTVSPLGFGLDEHLNINYIKALIKVLRSVQWTYFKIIHSVNMNLKQMVNEFRNHLDPEEMCIEDVIEIGPSVDDYLPQTTFTNKDGVGTILFTTLEDTAKILDSIQSFNSSQAEQKLFLFPWNVQALIDIKHPKFLKNALLIRPRTWLETSDINDTLSDDVNPWLEDFQTPTNESMQVIDKAIVVGVDILMSTINALYRDLCPQQNGVCSEFSDFKSLKPRLEQTFSMLISGMESPFEIYDFRTLNGKLDSVQIGEVDVDGKVRLELSDHDNGRRGHLDIPSSTCQTWCPKCYQCSQGRLPSETTLYLPGEIIITGVIPIHQSRLSPFDCDSLAGDILFNQLPEAFMFAVETAQQRYPYLLNEVTIGGLIMDSCSNPHRATQVIGNFETCSLQFGDGHSHKPSPKMNLAYVIHGDNSTMDGVVESIERSGKLGVATYNSMLDLLQISADSSILETNMVIVDLLVKLNWTYIYVVASSDPADYKVLEEFLKVASKRGVCVGKILGLSANVKSIVEVAEYLNEGSTAVVMLTKRFDLKLFFNSQSSEMPVRPWIVDISGDDWNSEDLADVKVPAGSLLIDKYGKRNVDFETFMTEYNIHTSQHAEWWKQYWQIKFNCSESCDFELEMNSLRPFSVKAARMIRSVDIALHAIHSQYLASCPLTQGICTNFVRSGISQIPSKALDIYFKENGERVEFRDDGQLSQKYQIKTYSSNQQYEVGIWRDGILTLQGSFFKYSSSSTCTLDCECENQIRFTNMTRQSTPENLPRFVYWPKSGVYNGQLWATVLVAIAVTGAFISIILVVYVVHKVCIKTLARRYVGLGILLLVGVLLLFLSVIPFVFTPSESLCGLRFVMPGCAFAFCFATILVKLTSLRDFRLLGLGGEVSNFNQYLFVAFITTVQIAIAIQWWILRTPLVTTRNIDKQLQYACNFGQVEFVLNLVYVIILIVLCASYAITVRRESKNMGEARLLLWCCWLCIPVWVAWIIVFLIQDPEYSEPTVCVAIVSCATLMMTVIFIPKIHMVAKIKYSISKGATGFQNGYKLDSEFFYERPYSLPGTMTTSYSTMNTGYSTMKTHPRSISNFDATLSY